MPWLWPRIPDFEEIVDQCSVFFLFSLFFASSSSARDAVVLSVFAFLFAYALDSLCYQNVLIICGSMVYRCTLSSSDQFFTLTS